jgi:ankyrin repeat protein
MPTSNGLLEAAACGDIDKVTAILTSRISTRDMITAVTESVAKEYHELLEVDGKGYSAASWACCNDDIAMLCLLLSASSSFLTMCTHTGVSLLHLASQHKSLRCLEHLLELLKYNSEMLNAKNDYGETPLHLAAGIGHIESVKCLFTAGVECLSKDKYGRSPHTVSNSVVTKMQLLCFYLNL